MSVQPIPPLDREQLPPDQPVHRTRWKRVVVWTMGVVAALIVLVVVAILSLLHSAKFHAYILRTAQEKTTAALGSQVQAREFGLHWRGVSPTVDLYDVVIKGAAARPDPPVLQVDHLEAQVQVTSLLRRTWYINEIAIDHPVVRLYVDKNGNNNLPKPQSSGSKSNTDIFDVGIRHVRLTNGEVYYNDRKSALDADLHDLGFQSAFDTAQQSYSGSLGYSDGHLKFGDYNPLPHNLQADFAATREKFTLHHAVLGVGASQAVLDATMTDYTNPKVNANYEATIDAGEFRSILKNPSLPTGVIRTRGTAQYVTDPNRKLLDTATVKGEISSPLLSVRNSSFRGVVRDLDARYSLANGNAEVRDLRAGVLGGEVTGSLTMRDLSGATHSRLQAALRGISLAQVRSLVTTPAMNQVNLSGALNATAEATWGKNLNDLIAKADSTMQAIVTPANGRTAGIPVNGVIHGQYSARSKEIALTQSYVRTPQTSLDLNGVVSDRSSLRVNLQSKDLHELETVADMFSTPTPGKLAQPLGLFGTAAFTGSVSGSTNAPHIVGQLAANDLQVKGSSWRVVRTDVDASPSQAQLTNGILQPAARGRINFALSAGLNKWSFTPNSPIDVKLNGSQLNVADLTRAAGLQTPIVGTLNANVAVHGTQLSPVGQGTISLTQAKVANETINSLNLKFQGTGNEVRANVALHMPAGEANGDLTFLPKQRTYDTRFHTDGIRLEQLQAVKQRDMQLTGVLTIDATGHGTLENPGLQLTAKIPELRVRDQKISGLNLQTVVANHVANVTLDSAIINTSVHGRGTVNLAGDYYTTASLDTQVIPLGPLVDVYAPTQAGNLSGQTELHATIKGPLKKKAELEAHVVVPSLQANYKNLVQLSAVSPIRVDLVNGVMQLQRSEIRGTATDLQFQGNIPISGTQPASLLLLGNVDLRIAQLLDPTISSSGQLRFNINSYGQPSDANVQGRIEVVNASFTNGELPVGLQNGNGTLLLTKDRLTIEQFRGQVGSGTVTASGGVVYRPAVQFDLAVKGDGIRVLLPEGIRTGADTQLALTGNMQEAQLSGQVRINELSFTPDFDLMQFAGQFSGETTPPPTEGFAQALELNVAVQSSSNVNLVSRTLSIQGAANLNVRGTAAQPVILGRVNLTGGDLIFSGDRYLLQGGTIQFVNPTRTEPVVNLAVNTTIDQYNIAMQFWGPVDHLHTTYSSDPALPPSDIINLIAFGKTTEASAANATPGALGAESLIASQVSSQLTSRVGKIAGISQLSIDPVLAGSGQTPGARVAIQQRVTSKMFVTFSTDVTSTQRQVVKMEYQVSPRVSVTGTRDQNGGFGFDTRFTRTW